MGWSNQGNRGTALEDIIEISNKQYEAAGQALIQKIPTPIKPIKLQGNRIKDGFFEKKSTVDFVGVYGIKGIAFDAKQTEQVSLPISNIHKHQIDFMIKWKRQGHKAFILVHFAKTDRFFRLDIEKLIEFIQKNDRKSIPVQYFEEHGTEVFKGVKILLDYLKGVA